MAPTSSRADAVPLNFPVGLEAEAVLVVRLERRTKGEAARKAGAKIGAALTRFGSPLQGVHHGPIAVLAPHRHAPQTAACLVEVEGLSHPAGEARLRDPREIDRIGRAIAQGIQAYLEAGARGAMMLPLPWNDTVAPAVRTA